MTQLIRPIIRTMPIQRAAEAANLGIENGNHGIDFIGDGRVGKDEGFKFLFANPTWVSFPSIRYSLLFPESSQPQDTYFFNTCLLGANHRFIASSPGNFCQKRFVTHLLEELDQAKAQLILFRISEANRMSSAHWNHLVSLDNAIEEAGRRLFLICLHQSDAIRESSESIDYDSRPQVKGRFRLNSHLFTGLLWDRPSSERSRYASEDEFVSDVVMALREYDRELTWPLGSEITYTQFFAPKAFAAGWRLESQVGLFRTVIETLRVEHQLPMVAPWPMKTFETFVYLVLVRFAREDSNFMELTEDQVRQAVLRSGYIELELSRRNRRSE